MNRTYAYYKQVFHDRPMPFAFVDLDLFDANIKAIVQRANGKKIRVASKSIRCLPLLQRVLAADPAYWGVMCFSASEAICLSEHGIAELLVGYPCWNAEQIKAVCEVTRRGKQITLMIDSVEHVRHLETLAAAQGVTLSVCLDIDMSIDFPGLHFGVWRSSVSSIEGAVRVYEEIERSPHLRLDGVMGYEAQLAGLGDNVPGSAIKSRIIRMLKARSIRPVAERRAEIVRALTERGATLRFVNGGGTGSMETTSQEAAVNEVTAGSGFYSPVLFDFYNNFRHEPSAGFAIEIVRQPKAGIFTCLGGGYIASGGTGQEKQPQPYLPEGAILTSLEGAGEVQTPILYDGPEKLALGDPIFMRHSKAGELCERFNTLLLVANGKVVDEVPTYRGMGWCYL
jgi:D-serine deaminase-like pyridoxal phosphate-dependent protein